MSESIESGIQAQISRLSAAKADIASAITAKGVTVPDGTLLDGMAALISRIVASSGSTVTIARVNVRNTSPIPITVYIANAAETVAAGKQAAGLTTPTGTVVVVTGQGAIDARGTNSAVLGKHLSTSFSMVAFSINGALPVITAYDAS